MPIKYVVDTQNFSKIPGSIFGYWISEKVLSHMGSGKTIDDIGVAKQGLSTSDNNRFLRLWHEVDFSNIGFHYTSCEETHSGQHKWFPYNKAGNFRKWSSINEYVVNYQFDGAEIKATVMKKYPYLNGPGFVVKNTESYFHHGVTWNDVATGSFCCRYVKDGFIFADAGPMVFSDNDMIVLGYMNSKVFQIFADIICQGLHYSTGHIPHIPFIDTNEQQKTQVEALTKQCVSECEEDWDNYETSWSFTKHPLL